MDNGISFLESQGFTIELASNVFANSLGYSATAKEKAQDINDMFARKDIKGIICTQGGHNCNAVLPYLDYDLIRANAKIFTGISDITVLLNAIHTMTGMTTFHGNDLIWGFGQNPSPYDKREFVLRLMDGKAGPINKNNSWQTIRKGVATGKLIGGNLSCLIKMAGTKYFPETKDSILFLEDFGEESPVPLLSSCFHHLKQLGIFEKIKGLPIGTEARLDADKCQVELISSYIN